MSGDGHSLLEFDRDVADECGGPIAGVDEAGRGCWAGPVVAAAVILSPEACPAGLDDSKKLSSGRREVLYHDIRASALSWGACAVSSVEIDRINILQASLCAMAGAVRRLEPRPQFVLVDGLQTPDLRQRCRAVVKGDGRSAAIAAASIVAKVLRDRIMRAWARRYPGYGFAENKGYGAPEHREGLHRIGPCPLHRFSYRPIAELDQGHLF